MPVGWMLRALILVSWVLFTFLARQAGGTAIYTQDGNSNGRPCIFPFLYKGVKYWSCISTDFSRMWCATTSSYDLDRKYGLCGTAITTEGGTAPKGSNCSFPFLYKGRNQTFCISMDHHRPWCATTYDSDEGLWGNCKGVNTPMSHETRLYRWLTQDYLVNVKPSPPNTSEVLDVEFGMRVRKLLDVDSVGHSISLRVWLNHVWKDERFMWDPSLFGGLERIRIPIESLWRPDIQLYNSVGQPERSSGLLAHVFHDGKVLMVTDPRIKAQCNFDLTAFPFDTQECQLEFGSWSYNSQEVNLSTTSFPLTVDELETSEWTIVAKWHERKVIHYACCPETFINMRFNFRFKRKTGYFSYMFIAPAVLLALLTPLQFALHTKFTDAKINLGVGIIVSITLLLLMLEDSMPTSNTSVPVIGKLYASTLVLAWLALSLTALLSNIQMKTSVCPEVVRKVVSVLGRIVCTDVSATYLEGHQQKLSDIQETMDDTKTDDMSRFGRTIPDTNNNEWQMVALVIHRVLFVLFFVLTLCLFAILPSQARA